MSPVVVLDYVSPQSRRSWRKFIPTFGLLALCMVIGGLAGWIVTPFLYEYTSIAFLKLTYDPAKPKTLAQQMVAVAPSMQSQIIASVRSKYATSNPDFIPRLKDVVVTPFPSPGPLSIQISISERTPTNGDQVVNAVIDEYCAVLTKAGIPAEMMSHADAPLAEHAPTLPIVGGAVGGALVGIIILLMKRTRNRRSFPDRP